MNNAIEIHPVLTNKHHDSLNYRACHEPTKFFYEPANPVVAEASMILQRQQRKATQRVDLPFPVTPESLNCTREGIYMLSNWVTSHVLRIIPNRSIEELFPRGRSAHGVSFGIAQIRNPQGGLETKRIAVKPFDEPIKAMHDAILNAWVIKRGFQTTDPICAIIDDQKSFVLTIAREGVQSLDTEPWHQFLTDTSLSLNIKEHFLYRLMQVSYLLADLHSHGIDQTDSSLRNFWATPEGKLEAIDWESAKITSNPPSSTELLRISINNLRSLYANLEVQEENTVNGPSAGIITGPKESRWFQFQQYVLDHYIDKLLNNFEDTQGLTEEIFESITKIEDTLKEKLGF